MLSIERSIEDQLNPKAVVESLLSSAAPLSHDNSIAASINRAPEDEFALNIWRACKGLPFTIFEPSPGCPFSDETRSRTTLRQRTNPGTVQAIVEIQTERLEGQLCSVSYDVVKLGNRHGLGIILNYVDDDFEMQHEFVGLVPLNGVGHSDALVSHVKNVVQKFLHDFKGTLTSSCTDHASAELNSSKKLDKDFWTCVAHGLQLVIEESLRTLRFELSSRKQKLP